MKAKFTKGEWEVYGDWGIRAKKSDRQLCENSCHATFEFDNNTTEEGFANAHLMACAPAMYNKIEELNILLLSLGHLAWDTIDLGATVNDNELLLAKARGVDNERIL